MLRICIFIRLVRFEDKDFWIYGGDFIVFSFCCCYFGNYLLLLLLLLLSFVVIFVIIVFITVIAFTIGVTIFIFIYFYFYFFNQVIYVYIVVFLFINAINIVTYIIFISVYIVFIVIYLFLFLFLLLLSSRLYFFLSKIWLLPLLSSLSLSQVTPSLLLFYDIILVTVFAVVSNRVVAFVITIMFTSIISITI